jgi:hypothetical protein
LDSSIKYGKFVLFLKLLWFIRLSVMLLKPNKKSFSNAKHREILVINYRSVTIKKLWSKLSCKMFYELSIFWGYFHVKISLPDLLSIFYITVPGISSDTMNPIWVLVTEIEIKMVSKIQSIIWYSLTLGENKSSFCKLTLITDFSLLKNCNSQVFWKVIIH